MQARGASKVAKLRRRSRHNGPNPVAKKGERNLFCPNYCQCLDFAIMKAWDCWACTDCKLRANAQYYDDFPATNSETVLYHSLPHEIFLKVG